jgi:hypothetical protein
LENGAFKVSASSLSDIVSLNPPHPPHPHPFFSLAFAQNVARPTAHHGSAAGAGANGGTDDPLAQFPVVAAKVCVGWGRGGSLNPRCFRVSLSQDFGFGPTLGGGYRGPGIGVVVSSRQG